MYRLLILGEANTKMHNFYPNYVRWKCCTLVMRGSVY